MGRAKEHWMEIQQIKDDTRLAEKLGITYEELNETDWHIEIDESKDGLIYNHIVYFHDGPKEILNKIIGLNADNQVWIDPYYDEEHFDYDEEFDAIIANKFYYDSFLNEIKNLLMLNEIELENDVLDRVLKRQLYVSSIGILETFLSETFINLTDENSKYFREFVETFPDFKKQKFQLNEIFVQYNKISKVARKEMLEVIYHNLDKVQNMYEATFKIEFPEIGELSKFIATRHDLVHRNGKTKEGDDVVVDKIIVANLIQKIVNFVDQISDSLKLKRKNDVEF